MLLLFTKETILVACFFQWVARPQDGWDSFKLSCQEGD